MLSNEVDYEQGSESDSEPVLSRSVGAMLRTAREAREISVGEVAERIRIPAKYLTMLEANDYGAIADEMYLLPFVRSYADFLGLQSGALSARFLRGIQPLEPAGVAVPEGDEAQEFTASRWFTTAAVMLFVALALYLVGLK